MTTTGKATTRVVVLLLAILAAIGSVSQANAEPLGPPPGVIHYAGGAQVGGSNPAPIVLNDGRIVDFIEYSADPFNMPAAAAEGQRVLVAETTPDQNGGCSVGGNSLGSIAALNGANELSDSGKCQYVTAILQNSPTGEGSIATQIPDSPLVDFPDEGPRPNVDVTWEQTDNDGYASCKSLALNHAINCVAGIFVYHYNSFGEQPSTGPDLLYDTAPNQHYIVHQKPNATGVVAAQIVKMFDPNFQGWSPEQEAQWDMVFTPGTPGHTDGPTARDILQPSGDGPLGNLLTNPVGQNPGGNPINDLMKIGEQLVTSVIGGGQQNTGTPEIPVIGDLMNGGLPEIGDLLNPEQLVNGGLQNAIGEVPQAETIPAPGPVLDQNWIDEGIQTLETFVNSPSPDAFVSAVTDFASSAMGQSAPSNNSAPAPAPAAPAAPDLGNMINTGLQMFGIPAMGGV